MLRTLLMILYLSAFPIACMHSVAHAVLVSHWRFDEGTGQAPQDSVGTNHGTLGANASPGTDDPVWFGSGKIGTNSLDFNGSNTFVNIGDPASLSVSAVTMAAWVNLDTTKRHAIMDKTSNASSGSGLHMRVGAGTSDDLLRSFVGNVSPSNFADSTGSVPLTPQWSHVAMTSDGTSIEVYINGVLDFSQPITTGIVNNTAAFRIGNSAVLTGQTTDGRIDDAGFWSNKLTVPQVRSLYTLGDNATLNYDLSQAQLLFDRHIAATGSTNIGDLEWVYSTDIFTGLGEVTKIGGGYFLQLNVDGSGVRTFAPVPEPSTGLLLGLGAICFSLHRRKPLNK